MNNTILIIVLVGIALVFLILILKKSSAKKVPPVEPAGDEVSPLIPDEPTASEPPFTAEVEEEQVEEEVEAPVAEEIEQEEITEETESAALEDEKDVEKTEEAVEEEVAVEPEVEEVEAEPKPEAEETVAEQKQEVESEPVVEVEEPAAEEETPEQEPEQPLSAQLSQQVYEERLVVHKEKQLAALTEAIDNDEESRREKLQVELVAITEALTFLNQSYEQEIACRSSARQALEQMQAELDPADYDRACASLDDGEVLDAEEVFGQLADQGSSLSAPAAYQSGLLAECRMDFAQAMAQLKKAVELDGENPDYLRSAALLARKLYKHKQALAWFITLEKVLAQVGEETVELALARRELAYTSALVGQHKKAGAFYKQAMVSLSSLLGKEDLEMGICWFQIGKLQEALGQYDKAEDPYKKALAIMDTVKGNVFTGDVLDKLAGLYMELEREQEAIPLFEQLCAFKEDSPNPDKATLAMTYSNLAEAYRVCGKYDESEQNYTRSLTLTEELRGKDHAAVGSILQELAQLCDRQGKKEEAQAHRDRAAAIFQRVLEAQEAAGQESVSFDL